MTPKTKTKTRSSLLSARRLSEPTPPAAAASHYRARLNRLVRGSIGRAYRPLLDAIPRLVESMGTQRSDSVRHDASPVDESSRLVAQADGAFGTDFAKEARAAAVAAGGNVKAHTKTKLRSQLAASPDARIAAIKPYDSPRIAPLIDGFVSENVALIRGIAPRLASDVQSLVAQGLTSGVPAARLAEQIRERLDIASNRAETIAIDQIGKLDAQLSAQRTQDIGVTHFFWRTSNDERVRGKPDGKYPKALPSHWDREGKRYSYAEPPRGKSGEPELPGQPIRCRCWQEPDLSTIAVDEAQLTAEGVSEESAVAVKRAPSIEDMEAEAARAMAEVEEMLAQQQQRIEEEMRAAEEAAAAREREKLEDPRLEWEAQGLEATLASASPEALEAALRRHKRKRAA